MTTDGMTVRWGGGKRADSDFAREQILDAALRCYQKNTFQKTRMEHIAREAKVSRTTIYRYFQNRDEVIMSVLLREQLKLLELISERVAGVTSFAEFLVETLAITNEHVPRSPIVLLIMREATVLMSRIYANSTEIFAIARTYFRARFEAASAAGELREGVEFEELTDWIIRVGSAFLMVEAEQNNADEYRRMLWRYLVPTIVCAAAIPPDKRV